MKKKLFSFALILILICSVFVLPVSAAQNCSLRVVCKYQSTPIAGAKASIYRIADYRGGNNLQLSDAYAKYNIAVDVSSSQKLDATASTVYSKILQDNISSLKNVTADTNGEMKFSDLSEGYYLVAVDKTNNVDGSYYTFAPFIVVLPQLNSQTNQSVADCVAYPKVSFTEAKKLIDISVIIKWDDTGLEGERPKSVTVDLLCDGAVFDTVVLSDENSWSHIWKNMDASRKWVVTERSTPQGYSIVQKEDPEFHFEIVHAARPAETTTVTTTATTTVAEKTTVQTVTTTEVETTTEPAEELPMTGLFWWPVPVLGAIGFVAIIFGIAVKKKNEAE